MKNEEFATATAFFSIFHLSFFIFHFSFFILFCTFAA